MPLIYAIAAYGLAGVAIGIAFISVGVTQVQPAAVSPGARLLILPGAAALWPCVLVRWLKARRAA